MFIEPLQRKLLAIKHCVGIVSNPIAEVYIEASAWQRVLEGQVAMPEDKKVDGFFPQFLEAELNEILFVRPEEDFILALVLWTLAGKIFSQIHARIRVQ